jgi:hypothetical protein
MWMMRGSMSDLILARWQFFPAPSWDATENWAAKGTFYFNFFETGGGGEVNGRLLYSSSSSLLLLVLARRVDVDPLGRVIRPPAIV